jgi:hypothetical protein
MCPPRIIAKESALEKKPSRASSVIVCLPALIRSASSWSSVGERTDAEQAVLGLQRHVHAFGDVVGHQRRDADAEVHVIAVAQFLRGALRHQFTDGRVLLRGRRALHGAELDALLVIRALDDAVDIDARRVDVIRRELPHLDELLDLGDADLAAGGDHRVEVPRGLAEDEVAGLVALPRLHDARHPP